MIPKTSSWTSGPVWCPFARSSARPSPKGTCATASGSRRRCRPTGDRDLEVLAGGDALDLTTAGGLVTLGHQGAHEHDALALLARDLRPVVGVGRVRQVLVLAVLLLDRGEQVLGGDAARAR